MNFGSLIPWRDRSQAPAARGDFFDPFVTFRREIDRMFDDFFDGFGSRSLRPMMVTPVIDVTETDKEIVITAEMPGLDEKDLDVALAGNVLTVSGEKKMEHERKEGSAHYTERQYGSFSRSIRLPFEVKNENVDARYEKGVLTVRVSKPAEVQQAVRHIEVKAA